METSATKIAGAMIAAMRIDFDVDPDPEAWGGATVMVCGACVIVTVAGACCVDVDAPPTAYSSVTLFPESL